MTPDPFETPACAPSESGAGQRSQIEQALHAAVAALQVQDMAAQLTGHAQLRLSVREEHLRRLNGDACSLETAAAHTVRQAQMCAGSVGLF